MDTIQKLQLWYKDQCNGLWEHQYGLSIDTLDNPGWVVLIDLVGTDLQTVQMEPIIQERTDTDWHHCKIDGGKFVGNGGPLNLDDILRTFLELASTESSHIE